MAKKSRNKGKGKAKPQAKVQTKTKAKSRSKTQTRNKRPNKRKPSNGKDGIIVKVDGGRGTSAVLPIVLGSIAIIAVVFLVFCLVFGYHVHWDKDKDHYCDVMDCNACMPVDEDGDGLCDICGACTGVHVDKNNDCKCDKCGNEVHTDADGDYHCDNCGEWMPKTGFGKGLKGTVDRIGDWGKNVWDKTWGGIKRGFTKAGTGIKKGFTDFGNWVESWWPGHVHYDNNGDGKCDDCKRPMPSGGNSDCEHVDENNNGYCDKCHNPLFAVDEPSDCTHDDLDKDGRCDKCDAYISGSTEDDDNTGDEGGNENTPPSGGEDSGNDNPPEGGEDGGDDNTDEPDNPDTPDEPSEPDEPTIVYTVTFNPNGGVLSTDETTRTTNADGRLTTMPGAYLDGYDLLGWYTLQEGGEKITSQTVFTSHTTVYAQWTKEEEDCVHIDEDGDGYCDKCDFEVPDVCIHRDADDDGDCDICGDPFKDGEEEPAECAHIDENPADSFCDKCGDVMVNNPDGGGGTGGNEGNGDELPDAPEICNHRDANDDGKCDNCGEAYEDGKEPEPCDHRDANDDGKCDNCGEAYEDGKEPEECNHRDADDDGKCDKCNDPFSDGDENGGGNESGGNDSGSGDSGSEVDLMVDEETGAQYYIDGKGDTYVYATLDGYIPETIQGQPVVGITDYFYTHCMELGVFLLEDVNYVIPDTVLYIGDYAFSGAAFSSVEAGQIELLTVVYEGNGMEYVGNCAFAGNAYLTYVDIPCADDCIFGANIFENCGSLSKENVHLGSYEANELAQ